MESFKDKFKNAFIGLSIGLQDKAVQLQLSIMLVSLVLAFLFHFHWMEWIIVLFSCLLVVSFEFLNSILERVMDFVHPDYHEKVRDIKDMSAGLVLMVCIFVLLIGIILYGYHFLEWIGRI